MDAERMQALDGLVAEVDELAGPTPEQAQQQAAEVEAQQAMEAAAREWGMVAFMIGGALSMLAPELRQVYTEDACLAWGGAMVPVAEKYGWNGPGNVPEIGLLIATAGLAVPSVIAVRGRLAQMKAAKAAAERAAKARQQGAQEAQDVPEAATDGS